MYSLVPLTIATTIITTFTAIPNAYADVNMMEASYQTQFTDLDIAGLKITRLYNSRSNFSGLFGFGWCSTFDTHLQYSTSPQGRAVSAINECGRLTNLSDAKNLKFDNGFYIQTLTTGLTRIFDSKSGELVSLQARRNPAVEIVRATSGPRTRLPRDAALGEGLKMRLDYDDLSERVVRIETVGEISDKRLEFTYASDRTLIEVRNAWSNTYRFTYDTLHNLTMVRYPDSTFESMTYDSDHDRLLSFKGRSGDCKESYSHIFPNPDPSSNTRTQVSIAKLTCQMQGRPDQVKREVRYDFTFIKQNADRKTDQNNNQDNKWMLSRLSQTRDGKTQSTQFSPTQRGQR